MKFLTPARSVALIQPATAESAEHGEAFEPTEHIDLLMRDLRSSPQGLSTTSSRLAPISAAV